MAPSPEPPIFARRRSRDPLLVGTRRARRRRRRARRAPGRGTRRGIRRGTRRGTREPERRRRRRSRSIRALGALGGASSSLGGGARRGGGRAIFVRRGGFRGFRRFRRFRRTRGSREPVRFGGATRVLPALAPRRRRTRRQGAPRARRALGRPRRRERPRARESPSAERKSFRDARERRQRGGRSATRDDSRARGAELAPPPRARLLRDARGGVRARFGVRRSAGRGCFGARRVGVRADPPRDSRRRRRDATRRRGGPCSRRREAL